MVPSVGRTVIYKTTEKEREGLKALGLYNAQKELPAIIVSVWGDTPGSAVNLKVMVDGKMDDLWITSKCVGEVEGTWHWPVIKQVIVTNENNFTITGSNSTAPDLIKKNTLTE